MGAVCSICINKSSSLSSKISAPDSDKQLVVKDFHKEQIELPANIEPKHKSQSPSPVEPVSGASKNSFSKSDGETRKSKAKRFSSSKSSGDHQSSQSTGDSGDQPTGGKSSTKKGKKFFQEQRKLEVTTVQTIVEQRIIQIGSESQQSDINEEEEKVEKEEVHNKAGQSEEKSQNSESQQNAKTESLASLSPTKSDKVKEEDIEKPKDYHKESMETPYSRDHDSPQPRRRSAASSYVEESVFNDIEQNNVAGMKVASQRLKNAVAGLTNGEEMEKTILIETMQYAIAVLDYNYRDMKRQVVEESDADSFQESISRAPSVDDMVRQWLVSTFTRSASRTGHVQDDLNNTSAQKNLSITHVIRVGIMVERFRRSLYRLTIPDHLKPYLKKFLNWEFDVFELHKASGGHSLRFICAEAITRFGICGRFKIRRIVMEKFLNRVEEGYCLNRNPYHNVVHGADVTQATIFYLSVSNLVEWLSELEVFTVIIAAAIHDYEHTGTTNNFHINTKSEFAFLYNDRSVLENYHVSAIYRFTNGDPDTNIFAGLTPAEFREMRALLIEIVLNTDMQYHFSQVKNMRTTLNLIDADPSPIAITIDKAKVLSLIVHSADVSHPGRTWPFHLKWTKMLCQEFFHQGDREKELNMLVSPLCDRATTNVASSQIGFIDFIVSPTFDVVVDMVECILNPLFLKHKVRLENQLPTLQEGSEEAEEHDVLMANLEPTSSYASAEPLAGEADFENAVNESGKPCDYIPFKWDARHETLRIFRFYAKNIENNKAMWRKHIEDEINDPMFFKRYERDPVVELGWVFPEDAVETVSVKAAEANEKANVHSSDEEDAELKKLQDKVPAPIDRRDERRQRRHRQRTKIREKQQRTKKGVHKAKDGQKHDSDEKEKKQTSFGTKGALSLDTTLATIEGSKRSSVDWHNLEEDINENEAEYDSEQTESTSDAEMLTTTKILAETYKRKSDPGV